MGAPQFDRSEIFWQHVCWEAKSDKILVMLTGGGGGGDNSKLLSTNAIWFWLLYTYAIKSAFMWYITQHCNLWFEGCLVTTAGCTQGEPAYLVSGGDHLESIRIALTRHLVFMLTKENFCLTYQMMVGSASRPYGIRRRCPSLFNGKTLKRWWYHDSQSLSVSVALW